MQYQQYVPSPNFVLANLSRRRGEFEQPFATPGNLVPAGSLQDGIYGSHQFMK